MVDILLECFLLIPIFFIIVRMRTRIYVHSDTVSELMTMSIHVLLAFKSPSLTILTWMHWLMLLIKLQTSMLEFLFPLCADK